MGIALPEFIEGGLKIIGHHRQVIVIGGDGLLGFVQVGQFAFGIGPSMIHVIAQQVAAAAKLHNCHRIGIFGVEIDATMI